MDIMLSLEGDTPQITLDGQEYAVIDDTDACLLDEQVVYDAFPDEGYEECALEHINLTRLYDLTRIASTESISPIASRLLKYASPVDLHIPSMEHFRNPNVNRSVTKIAKESILENVWKAIKKIFAAIGKFFKNLFSSSDKTDKKIKSIKEETDRLINASNEKMAKMTAHKQGGDNKQEPSITYHDLKAEINDSVNSRMSNDGAVTSVTLPKSAIDPKIKSYVTSGYKTLFILSTRPGEKIEYNNFKNGADAYLQLFKKLEGSIKTVEGIFSTLSKHMDYVDKLTDSDQQTAMDKHQQFVDEINMYCETIIDSVFTEKPEKSDRFEKFTDYVPGLIRWGAKLTPKENHVSQLVIGKRCYSDLSHIAPDQCYIEIPHYREKSNIGSDVVPVSNTTWDITKKITPIVKKINAQFEPYIKDQPSESKDPELDKLRREMYNDIIATIRNLSAISANLYVSAKESYYDMTNIRTVVLYGLATLV